MKFLFALLPAAVLAGPIVRDEPTARITQVSLSGDGCPSGTTSSDISDDAQTLTLGFDAYATLVGPGARPGQDARERWCEVSLRVAFPRGCTTARVATTYHGYAQVDAGVTGSLATSYVLLPGTLDGKGANPPPALVSAAAGFGGEGGVYTKKDAVDARVDVRNASEQVVSLVVRTRLGLQAANGTVSGTLTQDDATIAISQLARC